MLTNKLPLKLKDTGSFIILLSIGNHYIWKALCDFSASIILMPRSVTKKLRNRKKCKKEWQNFKTMWSNKMRPHKWSFQKNLTKSMHAFPEFSKELQASVEEKPTEVKLASTKFSTEENETTQLKKKPTRLNRLALHWSRGNGRSRQYWSCLTYANKSNDYNRLWTQLRH